MGEAGGLPSLGSHRVRHDWSDLAAAAAVYMLIPISQSIPPPTPALLRFHMFILYVCGLYFKDNIKPYLDNWTNESGEVNKSATV